MWTWKWVVLCMLALPAVVEAAQTPATQSNRDITLRITPEKSTVSVNQPVDVLMTLENPGHQRSSVDLGDDRKGNLTIEMINPFGERTKKKLDPHEGIARIGQLNIEPGRSYSQHLVLNEWVDLPQTGTYRFIVHLDSPIQMLDGTSHEMNLAEGSIGVLARDEDKLRQYCENVLQDLLFAKSYVAAAHSAVLLSYVRDRVAISYLSRAFGATYPVQAVLAEGFARLGTDDAAEALLDVAINNPRANLEATGPALSRLAATTTNLDLASRIRRILKTHE